MDIRSLYKPQPNFNLATSGSFFIISGAVAYYYGNYITCVLNCLLGMSSILFHVARTPHLFILDQILIVSVVLRGFVDGFYGSIQGILLAVIANAYSWIIYFSPFKKLFAYHPESSIATRWHMSMHVLGIICICIQQQYIKLDDILKLPTLPPLSPLSPLPPLPPLPPIDLK